jgi:hypothetical protein
MLEYAIIKPTKILGVVRVSYIQLDRLLLYS